MTLTEIIGEVKDTIDEELKEIFIKKTGYQDVIFDSINYSLFTGGKRIRPILLLKSCEMFCGKYDKAIPFH